MTEKQPITYMAYLLRIWRDDESTPWRAMLENAHSGEKHGFADLEHLFTFLYHELNDEDTDRQTEA